MLKRLLLPLIIFLGFLQSAKAQSVRERAHLSQTAYDLVLPEGKVHFAFDDKKVVLKLKPGVNPTGFFKENSALFAAYEVGWKVPFPEVYRPVLRAVSGKSYAQSVAQLERLSDVEYVAPVVRYRDLEQSLYDLFYVKLKSPADLPFLQKQAQEFGFRIGEKRDSDIYFCKVNKTSAGNSFEIAARLQSLRRFAFAEPDFIYTCKPSTADPFYSWQWFLNNTGSAVQYSGTPGADMKVAQAWGITTGVSTIRVAVLDCFGSAAQFTHPDITFAATYDATGTGFVSSGFTGDAHGICCAGIIRATANNNLGGAGIAYNAGVIAVKVGTISGSGGSWNSTGNSISDGITWAYQNADVISNSNTFGSSNSLINTAIDNGLASGRSGKGTLFFSSAGNSNSTTIGYPASYASTIAVAATSMCDQRKSPTSCDPETFWGSDYGVGVDIGAPGVKMYTTDLPGAAGYSTDDYAPTFNGTSSACPAAAAVMALILSANPNLTASGARALLESTCAKVGGYTYNASVTGQPNGTWCTDLGYGRVDAFAALSALSPCSGTPTGGVAQANGATGTVGACLNTAISLSASGSANGGLSYQWRYSATGVASTYTNISGAIASTYTISPYTTANAGFYQRVVTCTNGGASATSTAVRLTTNAATACYCTPTTTDATVYNITNFTTTGGQTNINNTSSGTNGYQNFSATASASALPGTTLNYTMTVAGANTYGQAVWIDFNANGSFADAGEQVVSSTVYIASPLTGSFTIPAGTPTGTKRMRILAAYVPANPSDACVNSGDGEYEDYSFVVTAPILCSGTPTASTISAPANVCSGVAFTVSSNAVSSNGITYQWESSASGTGGWSAIAGATSTSFSVSGLTATTFYRQRVTCTNSNQTVYSNVVSVVLNPITQCYCTPVVTTQDELITNVTVAGINNSSTGFGVSGYQNFTNITGMMQVGMSYPFSATLAPYYSSDVIVVWIDYNRNGIFENPGEQVLLNNPTATPSTGTITVPATALTGATRMRVRLDYNNTNPTPCDPSSYGNIEDYTINITSPCPAQSVSVTGSALTACVGAPVAFTATPTNGGATPQYQWKVNGMVVSGATGNTYTTSFPASSQVSVVMTPTTPCPATPTVTSNVLNVAVNPLPVVTVTASGATTFCSGGSVVLNGPTGAASYQWNRNGTAVSGATTASYTATSSGSYTLNLTNSNGCSNTSAARNVVVNPLPVASVTASGPTTFCAGNSVTLTASTGSSYLWSNGATSQSITATASSNYDVVITDSNGCSATSAATAVTVNLLPNVTVTAVGATAFCAGSSVVLNVPTGAASYQWSNNGGAVSGAVAASYTATAGGNYTVRATSSNGCSATSASTAITVNPLPVASITTGGANPVCAGSSLALSASPNTTGNAYQWKLGTTVITASSTSQLNASTAGSYTVRVTDANGCVGTSPAYTLTTKALPPVFNLTANAATTFCAGGSVTLAPNTATAYPSYQWSNNGTAIAGATSLSYRANTSGNYTLTLADSIGCSRTSTVRPVTVNPNPVTVITTSGPTTFCAGGSVVFTADSTTGQTNTWLINGVSSGASNTRTATASGSYQLRATLGTCTALSPAQTVTVNAVPAAAISTSGPNPFCAGSTVVLNAAPVAAGNTYSWMLDTTVLSTTIVQHNATAGGAYKVTVTNANGCARTSTAYSLTMLSTPAPSATITALGATTLGAGGSVTLQANAGTGYRYQWFRNNVALSGATGRNALINSGGSYTVRVTSGACAQLSAAVVVSQTANKESLGVTSGGSDAVLEETFSFSAFPNPADNKVTVRTNGAISQAATVQVMTLTGAAMKEVEMKDAQTEIDLNGMASGVYLLRYKDAEGRTGIIRLVKQ